MANSVYNVTLEEQVRWQGLKDQVKTVLKYNCESDQSSFHSNLKPSLSKPPIKEVHQQSQPTYNQQIQYKN